MAHLTWSFLSLCFHDLIMFLDHTDPLYNSFNQKNQLSPPYRSNISPGSGVGNQHLFTVWRTIYNLNKTCVSCWSTKADSAWWGLSKRLIIHQKKVYTWRRAEYCWREKSFTNEGLQHAEYSVLIKIAGAPSSHFSFCSRPTMYLSIYYLTRAVYSPSSDPVKAVPAGFLAGFLALSGHVRKILLCVQGQSYVCYQGIWEHRVRYLWTDKSVHFVSVKLCNK